jgi:hypothetical protein
VIIIPKCPEIGAPASVPLMVERPKQTSMGLAMIGVHPVTGQQIFDIDAVRDTQSVMFSCGMYDFSGGWTYEVGIPAKSGVGAEFSAWSTASSASVPIRHGSIRRAIRCVASPRSR